MLDDEYFPLPKRFYDSIGNLVHTCGGCESYCTLCNKYICRDNDDFKKLDDEIFCPECFNNILEEERKAENAH